MTETDLCNTALGILAHDRVITGDFRTATSTEALRCRLHYDAARRSVLSAGTWIFAETSILVCQPQACPSLGGDWPSYALPPDCLNIVRARQADDPSQPVDFRQAGAAVCCPPGAVRIIYVRDTPDLGLWPQQPLDAFAAELAARLAPAMTGSIEKARAFRADAAACLRNASLWNARQQPPKQPTHDRYAQSRGGGCR